MDLFGRNVSDNLDRLQKLEPFTSKTETLTSPDIATLTLTRYGPVLGFPSDVPQAEREHAAALVREWWDTVDGRQENGWQGGRRPLFLPFSVEVVDIVR